MSYLKIMSKHKKRNLLGTFILDFHELATRITMLFWPPLIRTFLSTADVWNALIVLIEAFLYTKHSQMLNIPFIIYI